MYGLTYSGFEEEVGLLETSKRQHEKVPAKAFPSSPGTWKGQLRKTENLDNRHSVPDKHGRSQCGLTEPANTGHGAWTTQPVLPGSDKEARPDGWGLREGGGNQGHRPHWGSEGPLEAWTSAPSPPPPTQILRVTVRKCGPGTGILSLPQVC